jgi:hypothetical protein
MAPSPPPTSAAGAVSETRPAYSQPSFPAVVLTFSQRPPDSTTVTSVPTGTSATLADVADASALSAVPSLDTQRFSAAIAATAVSNRANTATIILRVMLIVDLLCNYLYFGFSFICLICQMTALDGKSLPIFKGEI